LPHRDLTEQDMALITVLCQEREARCEERARAAAMAGNKEAEKLAITDQWRYRSLRFKMFSLPGLPGRPRAGK
jgi:hypothetical protein